MQHHVHAGFDSWRVFAKAKAANRMRHAEAMLALAEVVACFALPPDILDLGCGRAEEMSGVLAELPAASYTGIDTDTALLAGAEAVLANLAGRCVLMRADYAAAYAFPDKSFDLIWLGLFLHHLDGAAKREFFRQAARLLRPGGLALIHDPILLPDETRAAYHERIAADCRDNWDELSPEEKTVLPRHWVHGRLESLPSLKHMAAEAGLTRFEVHFADPGGFYAVFSLGR
jgi:SAM-dependent methyltransferase